MVFLFSNGVMSSTVQLMLMYNMCILVLTLSCLHSHVNPVMPTSHVNPVMPTSRVNPVMPTSRVNPVMPASLC